MPLVVNQTYTNNDVRNAFGCSMMSGMNKSNSTNTLVLVLKHVNNLYDDKQVGDIIYYTGKGQIGDQMLARDNRTLAESNTNGVKIVLFEVFNAGEYTYRGRVQLIDSPFIEKQLDANKDNRDVYVFPIKLQEASDIPIDQEIVTQVEVKREQRTRRLSDEALAARLEQTQRELPGYSYTKVKSYQRSADVVETVLRRATGECELCDQPAPFKKNNGDPYLEVHHIIQLAKGGADIVRNAAALCPNCHRKMHTLNLEADKIKLQNISSFATMN